MNNLLAHNWRFPFMRGAQSVSQPLPLTSILLAGDGDYLGWRQRSNT